MSCPMAIEIYQLLAQYNIDKISEIKYLLDFLKEHITECMNLGIKSKSSLVKIYHIC